MTSFPKNAIIRLVAMNGKLVIDQTGRQNGRGAYLCHSLDCFDIAIRKKRMTYALGVSMSQDEYAVLREEFNKAISNTEVCE